MQRRFLAGERDPYQLTGLRNWRVKASQEEIAGSLEGNWQVRHGMPFIDRGAKFYESQHRKLQINYLKRKAANFGFQIIEAPAA